MGTIGCYSLHVYCDAPGRGKYMCTEWPGDFTGRTETECKNAAKRAGWAISSSGTGFEGKGQARCPKHLAAAALPILG